MPGTACINTAFMRRSLLSDRPQISWRNCADGLAVSGQLKGKLLLAAYLVDHFPGNNVIGSAQLKLIIRSGFWFWHTAV